jgi:hypothetical protein
VDLELEDLNRLVSLLAESGPGVTQPYIPFDVPQEIGEDVILKIEASVRNLGGAGARTFLT